MGNSKNITFHPGNLSRHDRKKATGHTGLTLWMTGLSGSGKSTLAVAIEAALVSKGITAFRLDGDNVRHGLSKDLGFSPEQRRENIRRVAEVSALMNQAGVVTLVSLISPLQEHRDLARTIHEHAQSPFVECYIEASLEACIARDPKGLYQRAHRGEIKEFTGISAPFEAPLNPELTLNTQKYELDTLITKALSLICSD